MITIHPFVFGPFQENTYILYDETRECAIIDPGCYNEDERNELAEYISSNSLKPVKLINTHGHIDHVLGNKFISNEYKLGVEIHEKDLSALKSLKTIAQIYGLDVQESPLPTVFLKEGDKIKFGNTTLEILFTPGHSAGSVCLVHPSQKIIIGGDVLFYGSIGRTDLPGGDHQMLISSIKEKLFALADDFTVYPGHGPSTTIGFEKKNNPFLG